MELQGFENKARLIGVLGVKISQGGEVIAHKTWDEECRRNVYSASKSVTSCAVGFAVQEGLLSLEERLVDAFAQYLAEKGEYRPGGENRFAPALCNRLDRGTEGLVIAAKNYAALRDMNEIIRTDRLKKEYYTITVGIPPRGRFTAWWEHDEKANKVSIHAHPDQAGRRKQIVTDVDVLRTAGPYALCRIGLVTGRTHQIRAHLAYLGRPVLGDIKYGNRKANERAGARTQALCAVRISFLDIPAENTLHYLTGKVIKLKDPRILHQFDGLDKSRQTG